MNRKSFEESLWLTVLIMFDALLAKLLISGAIAIFLSPRMFGFVWFALAVLVVLTLNQIRNVFIALADHSVSARQGSIKVYSFIFFIPLFLAFTAMPDSSTAQSLNNRAVDMVGAAQKQTGIRAPQNTPVPGQDSQSPVEAEAIKPASGDDISMIEPCTESALPVLDGGGELQDNFVDSIYMNASELDGSAVILCGYIYKSDSFPDNTILISRLMISCCAADASLVGYHVKIDDANDYMEDEWIQVSGEAEIVKIEIDGVLYELPIIQDGFICRIDPFETPYIYP